MSRYGYLEVIQSLLDFEITRVDYIGLSRAIVKTCKKYTIYIDALIT